MSSIYTWQRRVFFAAGLGLLALAGFRPEVPTLFQVLALVACVSILGIPHGALDPLVAWNARLYEGLGGLLKFIIAYIGLSALALVAWIFQPVVCLALFLLVSAWHFSGDWREKSPLATRLPVGLMIVTAPTLFHPSEVQAIFAVLANPDGAIWITETSQAVGGIAYGLSAAGAMFVWRRDRAMALELFLLLISVVVLPPLVFFLLYFCGLHSPRHLLHALSSLSPNSAWITGATISLLTVSLGTVAFFLMPNAELGDQLLRLVFIGLAVLTVPHMLLIEYAASPALKQRPTPFQPLSIAKLPRRT